MSHLGFTMIELLVVISLVGLLVILGFFGAQRYITRAQDAERKADLQKYRTVLEEYFNDIGHYPAASALLNCGSGALQPYLPAILCDPSRNTPYLYVPNAAGTDYVLYARLDHNDDPIVSQYGCENGCGPDHNGDGAGDFNIGITNGETITGGGGGGPTPTPNPGAPPTPKPPSGCGNWCYANQCTTCCGPFYRCSEDGTTCMPDNTCDPCPDGVCTGGDD